MKIYYAKKLSAKGTYYDVIYVDLGYTTKALTFDKNVIAELLQISVAELYQVKPDTVKEIGSLVSKR